jgi:hypothetical protein
VPFHLLQLGGAAVSQELSDAEWLRDRIDRWSIGLHSKITAEDRERALSIAAKLERPEDVMSPAEFAERMRKIAEVVGDPEASHGEGDQLMTELLCQLGYGEGCDVFDKMPKWYA